MEKTIQAVGKAPRVAFDRAAVVFDKTTGKILHIHRVTVAREHHSGMDDGELHRRAMDAARPFVDERKIAEADVLHVEPEEMQHALAEARKRELRMHVDVRTRRLSSGDKPRPVRT